MRRQSTDVDLSPLRWVLWAVVAVLAWSALGSGAWAGEGGSTQALEDLLGRQALGLGVVVGALALAFFLGAVHALEPGHGKTVVAAYLIGRKGTVANAVFLGGVVTLTHTFSVLVLGVLVLGASHYVVPEQIYPWLEAFSGLLIAGVGVWLLLRGTGHSHGHDHGHSHGHEHGHGHAHVHDDDQGHDDDPDHGHSHDHDDDHGHAHDHDHSHADDDDHGHDHGHADDDDHGHDHSHSPDGSGQEGRVTLGALWALGVTGGIVPCPGALVILLLAVALHRIAFGLVLLVAFSLGLAAVLIALGILLVKARPLVDRFGGDRPWMQRLPKISAAVISVLGVAMFAKAVGGLLP